VSEYAIDPIVILRSATGVFKRCATLLLVTRVVIAHDYLTQRGGAERVVLAMLDVFPDARLVTSIYDPDGTYPEFSRHAVETLLPRVPFLRKDPRLALPILAAAFGRHTVQDADVVLCSSSGWAHGIQSSAPKIVYCHTPARWLYRERDYAAGHGAAGYVVTRLARFALRGWDRRAALGAEVYVANSRVVADRIRTVYGRDATVLHPPLALSADGPQAALEPLSPGFLLTVARRRGYKNTAAVATAAKRQGVPLVVVGAEGTSEPGVTHVGRIDDAGLRWLYANCRALVASAYEDFGLTPVEAMAFGKPVLALRAGGYLETVVDGETGCFFDEPSPVAIGDAIEQLGRASFDAERIRRRADDFSADRFAAGLRSIVSAAVR
jgi:glycosyltransferase involved in cell wall biosynthesis